MFSKRKLACIATLAAATAAYPAVAQETIKLGLIAPLSGSVALDGQQQAEGGRFAVEQFNKAGGLAGKQIELVVEDGECKPAASTAAAEKLATKDRVLAFSGAFCSSATKAVQPIAEKHQVPMVNGISSDPSLTDPLRPWFFRTKVHNNIRGKHYSRFIAEDLKLKKLVALVVDDDFGRSAINSFTPLLKSLGAEFVLVRYYKHGEVNFVSMLNAANNSGADGLFVAAEVQDGALLMKQFKQLQMKMPVVSIGSMNTPEFFQVAKADAEGVYTAEVWGHGVENASAKEFIRSWEEKYKFYPGLLAMSGYVEVRTILEALKAVGRPDRPALRTALAQLSWSSPIGTVKFDDKHQAHTLMFVTQNTGGLAKIVKTYDTVAE
jgi:branched-chain amino acid transport system substrate-binding protein